jgi:hypothetical protein
MTSNSVGRHAKGVLNEAKSRAAELPEDLMGRVRQTSQAQSSRSNGTTRRTSAARKTNSTRKRSSARKATASR